MRFIIISILMFFITSVIRAEDRQGYIIRSNGDTVLGILDIPVYKTALNKNKEIQFGDMWQSVKFAEANNKPKKMKAGDISGFGFEHEGVWYHYELLDLQKNYGKKAPKIVAMMLNDLRFFVLRVDDGFLPVYREYWNSETERKSENPVSGRTTTIVGKSVNIEIWIKNREGIFMEIAPALGAKKLKDFLGKHVKLEKEFLDTVSDKVNYRDAEDVLIKYNAWKLLKK